MNCELLDTYLADYLEGDLDKARTDELLDHVEHCDACRAEFQAYQEQDTNLRRFFKNEFEAMDGLKNPFEDMASEKARKRPVSVRLAYWVAAAILFMGLGLGGYQVYRSAVPTGEAPLAEVHEIEGRAQVLVDGEFVALETGMEVLQNQRVKVANDGYLALMTPEGNILEAQGGTQFSLRDYSDRFELAMNRGFVWAHLNKPPPKEFIIRTAHLTAAAKGTVYGVEEGLDRSIVIVAKSDVEVEQGGEYTTITGGEAFSSLTGEKVETNPLTFAWSRFLTDDLLAIFPAKPTDPAIASLPPLLTVVQAKPSPDKLTAYLPVDTLYLLDIDDYQGILREFQATDYSGLLKNEAIRAWWDSTGGEEIWNNIQRETGLPEILEIAASIDGQLVVGVTAKGEILVLAGLGGKGGSVAATIDALLKANLSEDEKLALANAEPPAHELADRLFVTPDYLVLSSSPELAGLSFERLAKHEETGFIHSAFYQKIVADVDNPRFYLAANLGGQVTDIFDDLTTRERDSQEIGSMFDLWGLPSLDYFVLSPSFTAGGGMNQAARLAFGPEGRSGAMNWLGEPAPMRGLDFFSPEIPFFVSAITRNPSQMLLDYLLYAEQNESPNAFEEMLGFLAKNENFFDAFGGDIAIGVDRPILPIPNVKVIIEIVDQAAFRQGLDQLIEEMRAEFEKSGRLSSLEVRAYKEREIFSLSVDVLGGGPIKVSPAWAFVDDYFIAGPGRGFVENSIDVYDSGHSIANDSERLLPLLPGGADMHFSLLVYQDVAQSLPTFVQETITSRLDNEDQKLIPDLTFMENYRAAGIAYAYARPDCVDFYMSAPTGLDLNFGMAMPLVANWLIPRTSIGQVVGKVAEADMGLATLQTAVEDYLLANGRLPTSLGEIANPPGVYIDRVPLDPFASVDGMTLNLIEGPAPGQVTLYSVGPDGIDDRAATAYSLTDQYDGPGDIIVRYPEVVEVQEGN